MEPEQKSNGAFIGLIIIIIILSVGGIYIWQSNKKAPEPIQNSQTGSLTNQDVAALETLQKDSNATDTSTSVDAGAVN